MKNARGLKTRLCPRCKELAPHRTLYAKTEPGGRTKWFQMFWACADCDSLNHVTTSVYRLESSSSSLPSALAVEVVKGSAGRSAGLRRAGCKPQEEAGSGG